MSSVSTKPLDREIIAQEGAEVPEWLARPFQLVSLYQMYPFFSSVFLLTIAALGKEECFLVVQIETKAPITDEVKARTLGALNITLERCKADGLEYPALYLERKIEDLQAEYTLQAALTAVREALIHIEYELEQHLFMRIPHDRIEYYNEYRKDEKLPPLFGKKVHSSFKSTRNDVAEAGNCFATGRYTACVFHSMRVVEKGLHALVHHLNNTFQTNLFPNRTIEELNWGVLIPPVKDAIDNLLNPPQGQPRIPKRDEKFYSGLAKEFRYFQRVWRDDVSHSRLWVENPNEAKGCLDHAQDFMAHLSTRIKE